MLIEEFQPALVYEKRRTRWKIGTAEIALDELAFGLFMEIEGSEKEIARWRIYLRQSLCRG